MRDTSRQEQFNQQAAHQTLQIHLHEVGRDFRTCPDWPWGPPSLLYKGYRVFPGGKERPGRDADPSAPSSAVVIKE